MTRYTDEAKKALTLATEVAEVIKTLRELHEQYPLLVKAVFHVLYGTMVRAEFDCPHCGKSLGFESSAPVGGILDTCEQINEVLEILKCEIELEGGDNDEPVSDGDAS